MPMHSLSLETLRRWYADEVRWASGVTTDRIITAFANVPRERFLPCGPWHISTPMMVANYQETPNSDVHHVYHNVMVALDPNRELNTALPSYVANILENASIDAGAHVAQIGAGLGYYSAIISHLVGPTGSVLALEVDPSLAKQCRINLSHYPKVDCKHTDGSTYPFEPASMDAVIVHGAATHIPRRWLEALKDGGRLLVPLSYSPDEAGQLARITRTHDRYRVEFQHEVFAYPCIGTCNDENGGALREAVEMFGWYTNSELRFDLEHIDESAWVVTHDYWISMTEDRDAHEDLTSSKRTRGHLSETEHTSACKLLPLS